MTHTQTQGADGAEAPLAILKDAVEILPLAAERLTDLEGEEDEVLSCLINRMRTALATPAPAATPGVPDSLREAVSKALHDNQFLDGWPEMVDPVVEAVLAARPEVPSDAGWSETFETIARWGEDTFGPIKPERVIGRTKEEMKELEADPSDPVEVADMVICLLRFPGVVEAIQGKMAINRKRRWRLMGDGTGYHIKDDPTPPSDPAPSGQAEG